jgi:hypothetical protein
MRLHGVAASEARANCYDVFVWHGSRVAVETNQFCNARDLQCS